MLIAQAVFILQREQTDRQTDATERPTHAGGYADVGNYTSSMDLTEISFILPICAVTDYFDPDRGAKYCDQCSCMSVCLFVRLTAYVQYLKKPHVQILQNYLDMLHVAMPRSYSAYSAINYVFPVL